MARCAACNTIIIGGYRSGQDRYCSLPCFTASRLGNFCPECLDATTPESPGSTFTFNTVGTRLFFAGDRCPKCHSIVQRKAVCAFFIPIIPLARYRMLYVRGNRYVGRRLRADRPPAQPNRPDHPENPLLSGRPIEPK